jgi:hypothetical protein
MDLADYQYGLPDFAPTAAAAASEEALVQQTSGAYANSSPVAVPYNGARLVVRAGVPQVYGALVAAANAANIPVLFSANAFAVTKDREFQRFNLSAARKLPATLRAALDSAGFVAMAKYGGYRWSESDYMSLVAARDWDWWAAQDYCVEPPVAGAVVTLEMRLQATALGYLRGCRLAKEWGVKPPLPVLQGWLPSHYMRCIELMDMDEWPDLVGIGSVCRRNVHGPDGVAAIMETLDKALPRHVKFHLFGVKGGAVKSLGNHPRFASIDSMAWDFGLRADQRTGRTQEMRVDRMLGWQAGQERIVPDLYEPVPAQSELNLTFGDDWDAMPEPPEVVVHRAVANWYAEHLLADHGYREIAWMALQQATHIVAALEAFGPDSLATSSDMADVAAYDALEAAGHVPARCEEQLIYERA